MNKVSLLMVILLVSQSFAFANQGAPASGTLQAQAQETPQVVKVKGEVKKRGVGEKSRVEAKLISGSEVKGYISKIEEASFAVTDKNSGQTTTIPYAEVQKIQGPGLSKGAKIGIAVGGTVAVVAVVVAILYAKALSKL